MKKDTVSVKSYLHGHEDLPPVSFDNIGALMCPRCGGNNLHQCSAEWTQRFINDGDGTIIEVGNGKATIAFAKSKDIPYRRDSAKVFFSCESCETDNVMHVLEIAQHKGCTYISWLPARR